MYDVMDGVRPLKVDGILLSESSSVAPYKDRWVEFRLFRTKSDIYVISRVGLSRLYHSTDCDTVTRNRLSAVNSDDLPKNLRPCGHCKPNWTDERGLFPETPRPWLGTCQTASGVLASLMKYDDNGTEYLTNVAKRLLEDASELDEGIKDAYYSEVIS